MGNSPNLARFRKSFPFHNAKTPPARAGFGKALTNLLQHAGDTIPGSGHVKVESGGFKGVARLGSAHPTSPSVEFQDVNLGLA